MLASGHLDSRNVPRSINSCQKRTRFWQAKSSPTNTNTTPSKHSDLGTPMDIVEKKVSAGDREIFDFDEFMSRPLFAHLAHSSPDGPRESPVWFSWDGESIWIIGGTS